MAYLETLKKIKKKQLSSVYLFYGNESFFIQNLIRQLKRVVIHNDEDNLAVYDLEEMPIEDVIADVETYPFFGERKLVIANNASFLKAKQDKNSVEHQLSMLETYLTAPVDYSILVLTAPYEKMDERKKITKLIKKHAVVANCNPIKEYELKKWIDELASQFKIELANEVYDMLEVEVSTNLLLLENELHKFSLYVGENGQVTKEVAEDLMSHTPTSTSLRLVDAVMNRDLYRAIAIYKDLEKQKEDPIAMIGLLAFQFRTLLRVKLLRQKGYTQAQMEKILGIHPYVIKIALKREKHFTIDLLTYIMNEFAETDRMIKQGKMEKELAFEMLLYHLVTGQTTKAQ